MTERTATTPRRIRPLTWVAVGVSVVVAVIAWWTFFGESFEVFYTLPPFLQYGLNIFLTVVGATAGLVLNVWAGSRGGRNRVLCVIAGLVLVAPLVAIIVANALYDPTQP